MAIGKTTLYFEARCKSDSSSSDRHRQTNQSANNNFNSYNRSLLNYCPSATRDRSLSQNEVHSVNNHRHPLSLAGHSVNNRSVNAASTTPPPLYHDIPGIVPAYQGRTSGPPPSYDVVINPYAPPPSYQSLFGQVREARKTSNGLIDLLRQLFLILIGTLGCTIIFGFLLIIPVAMMLVGVIYFNDCKAENIPSFLLVGGFVWMVKNILNCYNQFKKESTTPNRPRPRRSQIVGPTSSLSSSSSNSLSIPATSSSSTNSSSSSDSTQFTMSISAISDSSTEESNNNDNSNSTVVPVIAPLRDSINDSQSIAQEETNSPPTTTTNSHVRDSNRQTMLQTTTASRHVSARIRQPSLINITSFKCESMLNYFLIVWFLTACIVVYRVYEPDYENPHSGNYCNRTVYLYAFWLMTSAFIIMAIILSCLCCLMVSSLLSSNSSASISIS